MQLKQIYSQSLNRNMSNIMAAPSSAKPETRLAGFDEYYRLGGNCQHLHGEGGEMHSRIETGRWLRDHNLRSDFFLCTQICHDDWNESAQQPIVRFTSEYIVDDIRIDLDLIGTDYLDLVYLDDRPHLPFEPILDLLFNEIEYGRIHHYGFRNWSAHRLIAACSYAKSCSSPAPSAVITTELSLLKSTQPLWPGYIPFDNELEKAVHELGLTVFAHLADYTSGQYLFEDMQALLHVRPEWLTRWEHPDNVPLVENIQKFACQHGMNTREVSLAWMLNQPFPVIAIINLPTSLAEPAVDYAKVSQQILTDEDNQILRSI